VTPDLVRFHSEIEPLVTLIESTPRAKCPAMLVERLRGGTPYRQLLAALYLAGVRNVNPRPPGFALHCLFVIHAANVLSLEASPSQRTLPLFFALDLFKASQERDRNAAGGDYVMQRLAGSLPAPEQAAAEFTAAMESWNQERAERAIAVLARHRGFQDVFELVWTYGVRDWRNIGHKAIFVANAYRTLQVIGWHHAEPVMRSLILGLLDFGLENKVDGYAFSGQPYLNNVKRLAAPSLPNDWTAAPADAASTRQVLQLIREAPPDEACAQVSARIPKGLSAASIWDAAHLYAGELTMRTAGGGIITGIHAVSAVNGLHYAWQAAAAPRTRLLITLQAVGWMGQFRGRAENRKDIRAADITALDDSDERFRRASTVEGRRQILAETVHNTIPKANEVHYYKFPAAIIEDLPLLSESWRPHYTAVLRHYTKTAADPDIAPIEAAKAAL
jgi:hypothetical protein